jgi:DNA repair photolyase
MIRGDAMMLRRSYPRSNGRGSYVASRFRLALADHEALSRSRYYLAEEGIVTSLCGFSLPATNRRPMNAIHTAKARDFDAITRIIEWPEKPDDQWRAGFLAGVFDAEGSCSRGVLRVSNSNEAILRATTDCLSAFGLESVREAPRPNGVANIRLLGGLPARDRFFRLTEPAITRKLAIEGAAVKSGADLRVVSIEDLGEVIDMIDITTETGDFVANGVISHNCFARPTHTYLELNVGRDFDSQIIVKVNVAEVLRRELARPKWQAGRHPVALGTNTDPYQRAEGRYKLMPEIIRALAEARTPFSILTKGTLLRRDLPLLKEASEHVPVDLAMSIAIYDDELQQSVEPGTPRAKERLATVTAVRNAGLDCSVFMMPILPFLTDTTAHLDHALEQVKASGATSVLYTALHLKPGVKEWFTFWLEREHPELMGKYAELYRGRTYAPKEYRQWLARRIKPLIAKHGLTRGREDLVTGGIESSASSDRRAGVVPRGRATRIDADGERRAPLVFFEETDAATLDPEPTLF